MIQLDHSSLTDTNEHKTHDNLAIVHQHLLQHVEVSKLLDEPLCTPDVFIDVGFEVPAHVWEACLFTGSLLDGVVELDSEFEHSQLHILDLLFRIDLSDIKRGTIWIMNLQTLLGFLKVFSMLRV